MRSSEGLYFPRLDHVRAVAAFLVCFFHVLIYCPHSPYGPSPPLLSLLKEGHTGVALFMTLTGYLFARITDGRRIRYSVFLWNRLIRLAPLLTLVLAYCVTFHVYGADFDKLIKGVLEPTWPVGAWSITAEMHFYVLFPALLFLMRKHGLKSLFLLLGAAIIIRTALWIVRGEVWSLAYWTIIGRFDQFVLGIVFYKLSRARLFADHGLAMLVSALLAFSLIWHQFSLWGLFSGTLDHPHPSPLWIVIPTIEGMVWGCAIAAYDNGRFALNPIVDRILARIGTVSYSIYLLHIIVFFLIRPYLPVSTSYTSASLVALAFFPVIVVVSMASFTIIERPFLKYRRPYTALSVTPKSLRHSVAPLPMRLEG
jgi:peptidoglycan/LPS O-acetylase OafA/YrhL